MAESKTEKKEMPEKLATEAQIKLIKELYEETNYDRQFEPKYLTYVKRDTANKHIQFLKDLKSRQYQERKNHETGVVFDKIGFGMVYKLVWKACSEETLATKPGKEDFIDRCIGEFKLFKAAQEACRQFVQDGGLK